jgi:hypothetical protein
MLTDFEIKSAVHLLGLAALGFSLLAMSMKNILILRILSTIANFIYGLLLGAPPLIFGGAIVIVIHGYHIHKLIRNTKMECEKC